VQVLSKEARERLEDYFSSRHADVVEVLAALDSTVAAVATMRGNFLELERRFDETCATLGTVGEKLKTAAYSVAALKLERDENEH